jgi:hypothetical protein
MECHRLTLLMSRRDAFGKIDRSEAGQFEMRNNWDHFSLLQDAFNLCDRGGEFARCE